MVVAFQPCGLVPLLITVIRRQPGITDMLLIGVPVQMGLNLLNREVLKVQYPTSSVLCSMRPLLLGLAAGPRLRKVAQREVAQILALPAVVYCPPKALTLSLKRAHHAGSSPGPTPA